MQIPFVLTPEEYAEGYRAMLRAGTLRYRIYSRLYSWPAVVTGLVLVALGSLLLYFGTSPGGNVDLIVAMALLTMGVLLVAIPFRLVSMMRRLHRLQDLNLEITVTVGADGVHTRRATRDAETRFGWSAIAKSGESKNLILLFPSRVQFLPIPKRALTPAQADELRGLIAANVGQQTAAAGR
ncbi:MAG TPA: YcxB family protein [Acidobacteriaceae bacterium]|nr:YcxB family protein [Acidobacteriaceae bacterium]